MKIKSDFTTNSSSSSFVVIGATVNMSDIATMKRGEAPEDVWELMEPIVKGSDLQWSQGSCYDYSDDVMVGICYTHMNDDETLKQFKLRVQMEIKRLLGVETEVGHIEECWMDN